MNIDDIEKLTRLVNDSGIAELEVQWGPDRVRITRNIVNTTQEFLLPRTLPVSTNASGPAVSPTSSVAVPSSEAQAKLNASATPAEDEIQVASPIVGTYYDSPSPGAPSFVKVGDRVEPRQVLCIIESMKLMNEIESEVAGTVVAKLVENGRPVEYGQTLFTIRPL